MGSSTGSPGRDTGIRLTPVPVSPRVGYTFPGYVDNCVAGGYRGYRDTTSTTNSREIILGYGTGGSWSSNMGGHDMMNQLKYTMEGNRRWRIGESISRAKMASELLENGFLPNQNIVLCMMAFHSGYTSSDSGGSCITFQIASSGTSFQSVNIDNAARGAYDLSFCACMAGDDCPAEFEDKPWQ